MALDYTTLFTRLGKGFRVQEAINTARGTTLPPLIKAYLDEFDSAALALARAVSPAERAEQAAQSGLSGSASIIRQTLQSVLVETLDANSPLAKKDLTTALQKLVASMADDAESVNASAVTATATADAGNDGDGELVVSTKRPDGREQENLLAETVRLSATAATTLRARGEASQRDSLSSDWPAGSGAGKTLTAVAPSTSLLSGGGFDEETLDDVPDGWIPSVATPGTTLKLTDYEVQKIVVTGTPTEKTYRIKWTNPRGDAQTTAPLDFDAGQSAVQAALRALAGLSQVTVATTGTSPNYTHAITFTGVAGNLNQIEIVNDTDGTITPSTVSAGSANAYSGKAVEFDSDGSELTTLNHAVALEPLKQYAFCCRMLADVVPAAGVVTVDLVDGIGGDAIEDEQGTANSLTIDATGLTTSFAAQTAAFRTPRDLPPTVYLRIRISTAVSAGTSIFIDHAALTEMTELYAGGPYLALFSGRDPFSPGGGQVAADGFSLTTTNDRAGKFQEWFERNFGMSKIGLLLPSDSAGAETIDDSLIGSGGSSSSSSSSSGS